MLRLSDYVVGIQISLTQWAPDHICIIL